MLFPKQNDIRKPKHKPIPIQEYREKIKMGDRTTLAKAITLIESNHPDHFQAGQELLRQLMPLTGKSIRIGITGVPGAGKSTFIEKMGTALCQKGKKVAVLAIDPSSTISSGSILGDKTRMENLSREPNAFIRPSPSGGTLGGVHRKTRETILLCEAAGFEVIIVETIGVGQSEVIVRTMVDMLLTLVITGAGDELQGMKKGMMELADCIIVTKADGENIEKATKTRHEYNQILHFLKPATTGWITKAYTCSSVTGDGIMEVWQVINEFVNHTKAIGLFDERRKAQISDWLHTSILEKLQFEFFHNELIRQYLPDKQNEVVSGQLPVSMAVEQLINLFFHKKRG